MIITKSCIKRRLGLATDVDVARFLGVTKQAVGAWADDAPIPEGRRWQVIALRPDVFGSAYVAHAKNFVTNRLSHTVPRRGNVWDKTHE